MADLEKLKNMLDNTLKDKPEQSQTEFHSYLQGKMKEVIQDVMHVDSGTTDTNTDSE